MITVFWIWMSSVLFVYVLLRTSPQIESRKMEELEQLSKRLSLLFQAQFLIERTPDEVADALLIIAEGRTERATQFARDYLAGEMPDTYLIMSLSSLLNEV